MADIVTRLRDRAYSFKCKDPLCEEAAGEIESLRRKLAAIERFAETGNMFEAMFGTPVSRAGQRGTETQKSDANCTERDRSNHDAAPAARAETSVKEPTGHATGEPGGEPEGKIGTGNTSDRPQPVKDDVFDRSKPISDERLAALEELSALDQELELKHGITGNPMIKAQERTRPTHATQPQGSVQGEGSFRDLRNAKEPVAWAVLATGIGSITPLCHDRKEAQQLAARLSDPHAKAVPLYLSPTLTDAEREAVDMARTVLCCTHDEKRSRHADTLRKMLERLGGER